MPDDNTLPRHIAIIMDGNGRWAKERSLSRTDGHRAGVHAIDAVVSACSDMGIQALTLFAFSSENWKRPASEVMGLMALFSEVFVPKLYELGKNNVRVHILGDRPSTPAIQRALIERAESATCANTGLILQVAFNYGGQQEIVSAARRLAQKAAQGEIDADTITADDFQGGLYSSLPVDLLIRTGGEMRISNFLLYQCAYAEMSFVPEYWPDFTTDVLKREIAAYQNRERRFGGLGREGDA